MPSLTIGDRDEDQLRKNPGAISREQLPTGSPNVGNVGAVAAPYPRFHTGDRKFARLTPTIAGWPPKTLLGPWPRPFVR